MDARCYRKGRLNVRKRYVCKEDFAHFTPPVTTNEGTACERRRFFLEQIDDRVDDVLIDVSDLHVVYCIKLHKPEIPSSGIDRCTHR